MKNITKNFLALAAATLVVGAFVVLPTRVSADDLGGYDYGYDYGSSGSSDLGGYDYGYDTTWNNSSDLGGYDYGYDTTWNNSSDLGGYDYGYDTTWNNSSDLGGYDYGYDTTWNNSSDLGGYDYGYDTTWNNSSDLGGYDYGYDTTWNNSSDLGGYDYGYDTTWNNSSDLGGYDYGYSAGSNDAVWGSGSDAGAGTWGSGYDSGSGYAYGGGSTGGNAFAVPQWNVSWGGSNSGSTCVSGNCNRQVATGCTGSSCGQTHQTCTGSSCHTCTGSSCSNPNLNVQCDVSNSTISKGDSATFHASASGVSGSVTYTWSQDVSGTGSSVSKTFPNSGTYTAKVTARDSSGDIATDTCEVRVENTCSGSSCNSDNLDVQCDVSDSSVDKGDSVTFTANVSGGKSPYTYKWSNDVSNSSRSFTTHFNSSGTYTADIKVTDDSGHTATDSCEVKVGSSSSNNNLNLDCRVSDTSIYEGDCVTYTADARDGNSPYDYSWSGDTEGKGGNHRTITVCYDNSGSYEVTAKVTDDSNERDSNSCPSVVVRRRGSTHVTSNTNTPSGNLASIDAVYLSQVPYTGPEDTFKLVGFGLAVLATGVGAAWALRKRSDRKAIVERIAAFKSQNLARKTAI